MQMKNLAVKKILSTNNPILSTYPEYGNLFSILDLEDTHVWGWITTNFLHIHSYRDGFTIYKNHFYLFNQCPFLHCFMFPRDYIINQYASLKEFITFFIDQEYYIVLNLDRYYIKDTSDYKKNHISHQTLLYGYDFNLNIAYASDNLQNGKYICKKYCFNDIDEAFGKLYKEGYKYDEEICVIKRIPCERYYFDKEYLIKELKLYLSPEVLNTEEVYRFEAVYRYNIDAIKYQTELLSIQEKKEIRPFHLFYEHKGLMSFRLKYLFEQGYLEFDEKLLNQNVELEKMYLLILNKLLMNMIKNEIRTKEGIKQNLNQAIEKEIIFFNRFIDKLEHTKKDMK